MSTTSETTESTESARLLSWQRMGICLLLNLVAIMHVWRYSANPMPLYMVACFGVVIAGIWRATKFTKFEQRVPLWIVVPTMAATAVVLAGWYDGFILNTAEGVF